MNCFFAPLSCTLRLLLCWLLLCCASAVAAVKPAVAAPYTFAVVVPKTTSKKAQEIYDEIERGLRSADDVGLVVYKLESGAEGQESKVHGWLKKQKDIDAIITIGPDAHRLVKSFSTKIPRIAGWAFISPNRASGVSLNGDPAKFFENLVRIAPKVDRVFLVYNKKINGWWVDRAVAAAVQHKIDFVAAPAEDLRTGARLYQNILDLTRPNKDAIWIPLFSNVLAEPVMKQVLKTAWDKDLVVFANSVPLAERGVLFALYPDNVALGKQLAELAVEQVITGNVAVKVEPVKKLKNLVNARTAEHLGLDHALRRGSGIDGIYRRR